jgi:formate-dependent phosphoribosylglycinamide formyltransferase (GAR transformylase)
MKRSNSLREIIALVKPVVMVVEKSCLPTHQPEGVEKSGIDIIKKNSSRYTFQRKKLQSGIF